MRICQGRKEGRERFAERIRAILAFRCLSVDRQKPVDASFSEREQGISRGLDKFYHRYWAKNVSQQSRDRVQRYTLVSGLSCEWIEKANEEIEKGRVGSFAAEMSYVCTSLKASIK